jgi:thioredoxin-like negative regulator of GroEL
MKKQQILVAGTGVLILLALFFFGNTVPPRKARDAATSGPSSTPAVKSIGLQDILQELEAHLTPAQLSHVNRLKHSVVRGDVVAQQISADRQLARFWKDSVADGFLLYAYYTGEAAKLENSEKSLNFAARQILDGLQVQEDVRVKGWMAGEAKGLFERVLAIDAGNDSAKVGLGASYIFGAGAGDPTEVMQGIQQILQVARRDSTNMYAQFMLGVGGIESGQFDNAIKRLTTVVRHEPGNVEAMLLLAEAYQQKGDKSDAVNAYKEAKKLIGNPEMVKAIDQQIKSLQ